MVSADSHVIEPPDLYSSLWATFGDRTPCVRRAVDGTDWWWVGDQRTNSFAGGSQAGRRFDNTGSLVLADAIDNVRENVWSPARYVSDNLADGIGASVLYPTQQMQHYAVRDSALVTATCRAYNDWLVEFCHDESDRLRGIAALNADDADEAAAEIHRVAGHGLAGALLPVGLPRRQSYADPRFEPVWVAAEATGLPLSFHIGTYRADPTRDKPVTIAGAKTAVPGPVQSAFANADSYVRTVLADLIFAGVLERHPGLHVVSAEHEIGWFAHFVERMDYTYTQRATRGHRFAAGAVPSDFVRQQVWVQFCEDPLAVSVIDALGSARNVMWGADYPHSEGTFPRSRDITARVLNHCDDADRVAVLSVNAAVLYGIEDATLTA
jgi:predicted TIM-barrel fold metal-dependent hydrolase